MPWRLVLFLFFLAIFVLFAGFNIGNDSDISFVFYTVHKVPIFVSLFVAFLLGALIVLPFSIGRSKRGRSKKALSEPKSKKTDNAGSASDRYSVGADVLNESSTGDATQRAAVDAESSSSPETSRRRKRAEKKSKK